MLWPEKRKQDDVLKDKVPGMIDRTTTRSYLRVASGYVPTALRPLLGLGGRLAPWLFAGGGIQIGPIPPGTPIGLLANLNLLAENPGEQLDRDGKILSMVVKINSDLKALGGPNATDDQAARVFQNAVEPLLALSKCPDLVVNRGHYFGTGYLEPAERNDPALAAQALSDRGPALSDEDKQALIEFLKTF
jgi:hypothetical protein